MAAHPDREPRHGQHPPGPGTERARWLQEHRPGHLPWHWTPGLDPRWTEAALRAGELLRRQASTVITAVLHRMAAYPAWAPEIDRLLSAAEIGTVFDLGLGPRLLACTVNTALAALLESFPRALVLAPLPDLDPASAQRRDGDLFADQKAIACALVEQARVRAVHDHSAGELITCPGDLDGLCEAELARLDTLAPDPPTRLDDPRGGPIHDADVITALGARWSSDRSQEILLEYMFVLHRNRITAITTSITSSAVAASAETIEPRAVRAARRRAGRDTTRW